MPPSVYDWSSTPGSNTSVGGVSIAEGMSPALVNDAMRQILAIIRQTFDPSLQNFLNASAQLPVANGGTGAANAPAALAALGGLSSAYRDLPIVSKSAGFTFADSERGGGIFYFGASPATATINPQSSTLITTGAVYVIRIGGAGTLTVTRGAGVYLSVNGAGPSADAVMAPGAIGTLINWGSDIWTITGAGIS